MQNNTDLKNHNTQADNTRLDDVNDERKHQAHKWNANVLSNHGLLSTALTLLLGLGIALAIINWPGTEKTGLVTNIGNAGKVQPLSCPVYQNPAQACIGEGNSLCEDDMEKARIAWKYFENNYQKQTGLVNAADKYPSTTMWDSGSTLAATIAAFDLGLINQKEFDDRVVTMLGTLIQYPCPKDMELH